MQLTEKETLLLKDMVNGEKLSIEKYQRASQAAKNGGLKNLFTEITGVEQTHLDTLNQIQSGATPSMASGGAAKPQVPETITYDNEKDKQEDQYLCADALLEEKQISSIYEVGIFEFAQPELRKILHHIQGEEQDHGKYYYDYMSKANMLGTQN